MAKNDMQKTKSAPLSARIEPQPSPKIPTTREHEYRGVIWTVGIILVILVVAALAYQVFSTNNQKQTSPSQPALTEAQTQEINTAQQAFTAAEANPPKPLTAAEVKDVGTSFNSFKPNTMSDAERQELTAYMQNSSSQTGTSSTAK